MANNVFHQFPGQLFPGHQLPHNNAGGGLGIEAFSRFKDITKYSRAVEALTMMFNSNTSSGFFFIERPIIERLQSIFTRLDRNKSGELDSHDFSDSISHIDQSLRALWSQIRDRMDVNNDGKINFNEFVAFFVASALEEQQTPITTTGFFAADLFHWKQAFNDQITRSINNFQWFVENSSSPTKNDK